MGRWGQQKNSSTTYLYEVHAIRRVNHKIQAEYVKRPLSTLQPGLGAVKNEQGDLLDVRIEHGADVMPPGPSPFPQIFPQVFERPNVITELKTFPHRLEMGVCQVNFAVAAVCVIRRKRSPKVPLMIKHNPRV